MAHQELQSLEIEVARFRAWADTQDPSERSGEWETEYMSWPSLYKAIDQFVATTAYQYWGGAATRLLLYALARDNEREDIVESIAQNPANLMYLAEQALYSSERGAKWQLADRISRLDPLPRAVESLLVQFARDEDEYVRRRALLALAHIGSPRVEVLVESAWNTGDEHQRIAVLCALDRIGSPQVAHYVTLAEEDGRQSLAMYAKELREKGSLQDFRIQGIPVSW